MATTAELLQMARSKHAEFHQHQQHGQPAMAREAMLAAQTARQDAEAADPEHEDPAWAADKAPSADILNFFRLYLEKTV